MQLKSRKNLSSRAKYFLCECVLENEYVKNKEFENNDSQTGAYILNRSSFHF